MYSIFYANKLEELMRSLYALTGIRIVLFDADLQEVLAVPSAPCAFCSMMKAQPHTRERCHLADRQGLEACRREKTVITYHCHASLTEAAMPIVVDDVTVGCLVFGQVLSSRDQISTPQKELMRLFSLPEEEAAKICQRLLVKSPEEIAAAADILEACAGYIATKEWIRKPQRRTVERVKEYVEEHLSENLDTTTLCAALGISRSQLYVVFADEWHMGIAEYVRNQRMKKAKEWLRTTDRTISEIARDLNFSDYNYFSRVFKASQGMSPRQYRAQNGSQSP